MTLGGTSAAALALGVLVAGCGGATAAKVAYRSTTTTAAPTTTTVPVATTTPTPTNIFTQSGSGVVSTQSFTVPANWNLNWTYTCDPSVLDTGLTVYVNQGPGQGTAASLYDTPLLQSAVSGSGTQYYHYGGSVYLQIVSGCSWSVAAATP